MTLSFIPNSYGQLTPGPLHRVHESLEGLKNCTQCHAIGSKDFRAKCLDCHTLLKQALDQGKGLHANKGYQQCQLCHSEHHGKDFELIHWKAGLEAFDHNLTGYTLVDKHLEPSCRDCHQSANIPALARITAAGKDPERTFLGLDQDCISCHHDPHEAQLEANCLSCHNMTGWTPAPGFNHDNAAFKLLGAHRDVTCESCHPPIDPSKDLVVRSFKPVAHQQCTDCHEDTHNGTLPTDCLSCHDLDSWKPAPTFNHDETAYPLTGRHREVSCEQCHSPTSPDPKIPYPMRIFEGVAFSSCTECHRDPHENRLGNDCTSCHQTDSWNAIRDKAFNHNQTRFPLKGLHLNLDCESCHISGKPLSIEHFTNCTDCHQDEHQGQFDKEKPRDCLTCHTETGFLPALFTVHDHLQTSFPLKGGHLAQPCIACHIVQGSPRFDPPTTLFALEGESCADCHANPHGEHTLVFAGEKGCETCHEVTTWSQIAFDHNQTSFPIRGDHSSLSCESCHAQPNGRPGFYLQELQKDCASCHEDIHLGQFNNHLGISTCETCHSNATWQPDLFDHNSDASFSLDGAHVQTPCSGCHPKEIVAEQTLVRFKPLAANCEDCHTTLPQGGGR